MYSFIFKAPTGYAFIVNKNTYQEAESEWLDMVKSKVGDGKIMRACDITPIMEGILPKGVHIVDSEVKLDLTNNVK